MNERTFLFVIEASADHGYLEWIAFLQLYYFEGDFPSGLYLYLVCLSHQNL
jgi:hypothetical protein